MYRLVLKRYRYRIFTTISLTITNKYVITSVVNVEVENTSFIFDRCSTMSLDYIRFSYLVQVVCFRCVGFLPCNTTVISFLKNFLTFFLTKTSSVIS